MAKSRYWEKQFATFDANRGKFIPTWSWTALIFNVFWYAWKGMWPKFFMLLIVVSVLGQVIPKDTAGHLWIVLFWFLYPPMFGKWDYYLVKKRGTYFW